jgi:hypothetical protein
LIPELPGFDPRKNCNQYSSRSFIDLAKIYRLSEELIDYLESLSPPLPQVEVVDYNAIDLREFCGVAELRGHTCDVGIRPQNEVFLTLDTVQKIYTFIGQHPFAEGNSEFFRDQVKIYEQYHKSSQKAIDAVRESYQNFIATFERIKARVESHVINILSTADLMLDHSISDGHDNGCF